MTVMKNHDALQAHPSQQAYSGHLRVYVQIGLSERGKVSGVFTKTQPDAADKQANRCCNGDGGMASSQLQNVQVIQLNTRISSMSKRVTAQGRSDALCQK